MKKIKIQLDAEKLKAKLNLQNGLDGKNGVDGKDGLHGKDGLQGQIGPKGLSGTDGLDGKPGENGKDGSPDTRLQIVEKINKGKGKDTKIKKEQIEGLDDNKLSDDITNRAIGIVDQRTSFLINKINNLPVSSDEKVKYDGGIGDIAGYLSAKIVAGTGITLSEGTGADENKLKITNSLDLSGYVPYTGATTDVELGTHYIKAGAGLVGSPSIRVSNGGGLYTANTTELGISNGTASLRWNGTDFYPGTTDVRNLGSATNNWLNVYANKFIAKGGTSSQFLKADGSVDSSTYLTEIIYDGMFSNEDKGATIIFDGGV